MIINYDIEKINNMLQDFYNATGVNMGILGEGFSFVVNKNGWEKNSYCKAIQNTKDGRSACLCSDTSLFKKSRESKKAEYHICHAGLVDVSVPILYNDNIIGYIIFGQIRINTDFSALKEYIISLGLDEQEMEKFYSEISVFDYDRLQSISNIAEMIAKHILLENMLKPDFDENIQKALYYINENLEKELTIENISKNVNISKSALYRNFHSYFNSTVSEYINKKRIEKSLELLKEGNLSIEEIALRVGFSGGSYFSKMFKKEKGVSPLKYKKQNLM